ncbi:MAG: DNA-binding domain-containing protein [Proteobacteria bacterium]|nr:DNA-binding domain-containing protein [Pseudomonadota bacterium]
MSGHIEVKAKRPGRDEQDADAAQALNPSMTQAVGNQTATASGAKADTTAASNDSQEAAATPSEATPTSLKPTTPKPLRAPGFNKPNAAADQALTPKPGTTKVKPVLPHQRAVDESTSPSKPGEIQIGSGVDGFEADDGWLGDDDDVRAVAAIKPKAGQPVAKPPAASGNPPKAAAIASGRNTTSTASNRMPMGNVRSSEQALTTRLITAPVQAPGSDPSSQPTPIVLQHKLPELPELPQDTASRRAEPSATALAFMAWLQQGLASREIKYNESGAAVHFTAEGMALVSPLIFKLYASQHGPQAEADMMGLQVQREVLKAGWHRMAAGKGSGKVNILSYAVQGKGSTMVGKLSAVVLTQPDRFVLPVPPTNPVLKLV